MRLIDADKLPLNTVGLCDAQENFYGTAEVVFVEDIEQAPTVDAVPVVYGRWVWDLNGMDWGLGAWVCSECQTRNNNLPCDEKMNPYVFSGSKYCPNCGAKMGGGV